MQLSRRVCFALLLVLLTLATYAPVWRAGYIWDDDSYLTDNPTLLQPDALRRIWFSPDDSPQYYPMVFTTLYLEKSLWGFRPLGYHLVNMLLHAGSAILLWLILRRLGMPGAELAAAIFAVHPLAVESVAWVTELKNTQAGFFALLSVLLYLPLVGNEKPLGRDEWWRYGTSLLLFVLAMLSKTVACGEAPVLLAIVWWKRDGVSRRDCLLLAPFFVIGAGLGLLTARLEVEHVGAVGKNFAFNWGDRILIAGRAIWFYVGKTIWPFDLAFFYRRWGIDVRVWWQWLFPAAAIAAFAILWRLRARIGRGPVAGAAAFVALLFPALGFFNVYPMLFSFVADHFAYLALMVGIPLGIAAVDAALRRWLPGKRATAGTVLGIAVVAAFAGQSFATARNYHDEQTLWTALAKRNQHWMAYARLAWLDLHDAAAAQQAGDTAQMRSLAHHAFMLDALVRRQKPDLAEPYDDDAAAAWLLGDLPRAEASARQSIKVAPTLSNGYQVLERVLAQEGKKQEAVAVLMQALRLVSVRSTAVRPNLELELGKLLMDMGRDQEAATAFEASAALGGGAEAWRNLGMLRALDDQYAQAREAFRRAIALKPDDRDALEGLARAAAIDPHATQADLTDGLRAAQAACGENPSARQLDALGMVKFRLGDRDGARAAGQEALRRAAPDERTLIQRHLAMYALP
ncbi:MAG TPA: tetratricopeptide repeat protein [Phycisphaerae bacterium]|nr:tetratricopeptide repeat protein [Phycisphaerae bacterium]